MYLITATGDRVHTTVAIVAELSDALDAAENVAANVWLARFAALAQDGHFNPDDYRTVRVTEFRYESLPRVLQTYPVCRPSNPDGSPTPSPTCYNPQDDTAAARTVPHVTTSPRG